MNKLFVSYIRLIPFIFFSMNVFHSFGQTEKQGLPFIIEKDPVHLKFNTTESEICPAVIGSNLWFSINKYPEVDTASKKKLKGKFYNLVKVEIDGTGNPKTRIVSVPGLENYCQVGSVSFCEKTGELFVTISNVDSPEVKNKVFRKKKVNLCIVVAKEDKGIWKIVGKLPFNNSTYSISHPSVSISGDTLFFISDNPETSKGGTDIFMSVRKDSIWGNPVNLGDVINSTSNEISPFYSPEGILFFSSDKIEGFGGFDIYYSFKRNKGFDVPVNFGSQINSGYDDFGFILDCNHNNGYFASNRPGFTGGDDLFQISLIRTRIVSKIVEKGSGKPVKNALVKLTKEDGSIVKETKSSNTGDLIIDYPGNAKLALSIEARNYSGMIFKEVSSVPSVIEMEKEVPQEEIVFNFINKNLVNPETDSTPKMPLPQDSVKQKTFGQSPTPKPEKLVKNQIRFSVQVGAFANPVGKSFSDFKGISNVQVRKIGNIYIYHVALFDKYEDAQNERNRLAKFRNDCFVIAFDGERKISVKEALEKVKK